MSESLFDKIVGLSLQHYQKETLHIKKSPPEDLFSTYTSYVKLAIRLTRLIRLTSGKEKLVAILFSLLDGDLQTLFVCFLSIFLSCHLSSHNIF